MFPSRCFSPGAVRACLFFKHLILAPLLRTLANDVFQVVVPHAHVHGAFDVVGGGVQDILPTIQLQQRADATPTDCHGGCRLTRPEQGARLE